MIKRFEKTGLLFCLALATLLLLGGCGSKTAAFEPGITEIPDGAFKGKYSLLSAEIPDTVTRIGNDAFSGCESLKTIAIPDSVTSIGDRAFQNCSALTEIVIPDSVTWIGKGAFSGCGSLVSVKLPKGLTVIGPQMFQSCRQLASIDIPDTVKEIGNAAFSGCESLTGIRIPKSVSIIGIGAFSSCEKLTQATLPEGLDEIPEYLFSSCLNLAGITLPDSVRTIGEKAFFNCTSLQTAWLPDSVENVGDNAFLNCNSLEQIRLPDRAALGSGVFTKCPETAEVTVSQIRFAEPAFTFSGGITAVADGSRTTTLGSIMAGESILPDKNVRSVTIPDSVTAINANAFQGYSLMETVVIPDTVTVVGDKAFSGCKSLKSVDLPDSVREIGAHAFEDCADLETVILPSSLEKIGALAFSGCASLRETRHPDTPLFSLGAAVFDSTPLVRSVKEMLPESFEEAESFARSGIEAEKMRFFPYNSNISGLWYEMYNLLPPERRTFDPDEADCILLRTNRREKSSGQFYLLDSSDQSTSDTEVYDAVTDFCLVMKDGTVYSLGRVWKTPKETGETILVNGGMYRKVISPSYASAEEAMDRIGSLLCLDGQ